MSFIRHLRRERVHDELDEHPPPRRWGRVSRYGRVRHYGPYSLLAQLVWGADAPMWRKGRRDLWIVTGLIFGLTIALLVWNL